MAESKFSPEEIERERRKATSRHRNLDEAKLQSAKDMITAARTDDPDAFAARLLSQGMTPGSERWQKAMEQYWIIRRGPVR
jgi:hypothetical protein